ARAAIALAGHSTFSDEQGTFEIQFPRGDWELRAIADGFESTVLQVNAADVWQRGFSTALTLKAQEWRGQVRASDTQEPLAGATVELNGASLITNEQGEFSARGVRNSTKIKIQKPGYRAVTMTVQSA